MEIARFFPDSLSVLSAMPYPAFSTDPRIAELREFVYYNVKQFQKPQRIRDVFDSMKNSPDFEQYSEFFDSDTTMVPVPSSKVWSADMLWAPFELCSLLNQAGLGNGVRDLVRRHSICPKSHAVKKELRPVARKQFETMKLNLDLIDEPPAKVLLVDDLVTFGTTIMACAARLRQSWPKLPIRAFAVARVEQGFSFGDSNDALRLRTDRIEVRNVDMKARRIDNKPPPRIDIGPPLRQGFFNPSQNDRDSS